MIGWLLVACVSPGERFFVEREGAVLPVWVQGDPASRTLLLVQHGSGSTGWFYDLLPAMDRLEEQVAVVYWDQRGAGTSLGRSEPEDLRLEVSVADLEAVLAVVRDQLPAERVVLLGHSLGGGISQGLLRTRPEGIAGYVDVSGGRSLPGAWAVVREELLADAAAQGWTEAIRFYEAQTGFPREPGPRAEHAEWVTRALALRGYDLPGSTRAMAGHLAARGLPATLGGPFDLFAYGQNAARFVSTYDLDGVDLSTEAVASIDVPALVIAGRHDLSVPVAISEASFAAFGEGREGSGLVILERAGHFPMWDQPDAFVRAVSGFLESL